MTGSWGLALGDTGVTRHQCGRRALRVARSDSIPYLTIRVTEISEDFLTVSGSTWTTHTSYLYRVSTRWQNGHYPG